MAALSPPLEDEVDTATVESAATEVQPPEISPTPAEVLSFTSPTPPKKDVSEETGDLFPINPARGNRPSDVADGHHAPEEESARSGRIARVPTTRDL